MGGYHPGFYQVATVNQWFAPGNYMVYASDESRWGIVTVQVVGALARSEGTGAAVR